MGQRDIKDTGASKIEIALMGVVPAAKRGTISTVLRFRSGDQRRMGEDHILLGSTEKNINKEGYRTGKVKSLPLTLAPLVSLRFSPVPLVHMVNPHRRINLPRR